MDGQQVLGIFLGSMGFSIGLAIKQWQDKRFGKNRKRDLIIAGIYVLAVLALLVTVAFSY